MGPLGQPLYVPNSEVAMQHVRAVPCKAGSAVLLSHRVIHWGSQGLRPPRHRSAFPLIRKPSFIGARQHHRRRVAGVGGAVRH